MKYLPFVFILIAPSWLWAHSGGLNSSGCHSGSKPYHCHRSASEMTKSSSGGNRLKCSSGSTSKDCNSDSTTTTSSQSETTIFENKVEKTHKKNTPNADGEPITFFGFNFDKDTPTALNDLQKRFGCSITGDITACFTASSILFTFTTDPMGDLSSISFNCELFNGCTYSLNELFQALSERVKLVGDFEKRTAVWCDHGVAGEKICFDLHKKLTMTREKFRRKPISFD